MSKSVVQKTFDAPGLGYDLEMDGRGVVYRLDSNGKRAERIAFRDEQGVWQLIVAYPILSSQLADTLEIQYRAK